MPFRVLSLLIGYDRTLSACRHYCTVTEWGRMFKFVALLQTLYVELKHEVSLHQEGHNH